MATYTQLTRPQRYTLQTLRTQPLTQKQIAAQMGISPATVSRELRRNAPPDPHTPYQAELADQQARWRCHRQTYKLKGDLLAQVNEHLHNRLSPEQVSGLLAKERGQAVISHEAIYGYIYRQQQAGNERPISFLRLRSRKRYKPRGRPKKPGPIPNRVGIEQRPQTVAEKQEVGHWEADTVIGKDHDGVLLTLVERVTKYTLLVKLPTKEALPLAKAATKALYHCVLPTLTITFDNGGEFAGHEYIANQVGAQTYFADPHSPWQRGLNENTNGLIRQYIPKTCRISEVKLSDVNWIQDQLNHRPRKSLGFLTPAQLATNHRVALQT